MFHAELEPYHGCSIRIDCSDQHDVMLATGCARRSTLPRGCRATASASRSCRGCASCPFAVYTATLLVSCTLQICCRQMYILPHQCACDNVSQRVNQVLGTVGQPGEVAGVLKGAKNGSAGEPSDSEIDAFLRVRRHCCLAHKLSLADRGVAPGSNIF